jgi:hypothetical protein
VLEIVKQTELQVGEEEKITHCIEFPSKENKYKK